MVTLLGSHPVSLLGPIEGTLIFKIDRALVRFHRSSYAIGPPVVYLGYETTNLYPTLDR
jgi:hypothetical protein